MDHESLKTINREASLVISKEEVEVELGENLQLSYINEPGLYELQIQGEEGNEEAQELDDEEEEESYEYTENQVKEMRKAFKVYDAMKTDAIPIHSLGSVLRTLGQNPTDRQLREHAKWLEASPRGGMVRFKEFLIIMGRTLSHPITAEQALKGFRCLDEDIIGVVSCDQLRGVLTNTAERLFPKEFSLFLKYADPKRKGVVKYEDFVARMNRMAEGGGAKKRKKRKKGKKKGKKTKKIKHREGGDDTSSC